MTLLRFRSLITRGGVLGCLASTASVGGAVPALGTGDMKADELPAKPAVVATDSPLPLAPLELRLAAAGPDAPWVLQVKNQSGRDLLLTGDLSLLWLEVESPAQGQGPGGQRKRDQSKKQSQSNKETCRLPREMSPEWPSRGSRVYLPPGGLFLRQFDPRLFCFSAGAQQALVPGSTVIPHFGWPDATKTTWQKGRKVELTLPPKPPFVAVLAPARARESEDDTENAADETGDEAPDLDMETLGELSFKNLSGEPVFLDARYSKWAEPTSSRSAHASSGGLSLYMLEGSDAAQGRDATITLGIKNAGDREMRFYFRREMVEFTLTGPEGPVVCPPPVVQRDPDPQELIALAPGKKLEVTTRLTEVCPYGAFAASGLYQVEARLARPGAGAALEPGTEFLETPDPALVRVRTPTRPLLISGSRPRRAPPPPAVPVLPPVMGVPPTVVPVPPVPVQ